MSDLEITVSATIHRKPPALTEAEQATLRAMLSERIPAGNFDPEWIRVAAAILGECIREIVGARS